ncbi:MAG: hypothetical protein ABI347_02800 [Nitrososphaera sp.]|jgi:hypothetical protein
MTSLEKAMQFGANKPLSISLPPIYFDILETMANLAGRDINELATKRLMQIIIEDVVFDEGYYAELITKSWKEDLKDDSYFKDVCG